MKQLTDKVNAMHGLKIGVFGAAFDPPTLGHQDALLQCIPSFDKILLVPSFKHAFGKEMSSWQHRLAMLQLFIQAFPAPYPFEMETIEKTLAQQDKPVYTFDVMTALQSKYKNDQLSFIIGPDNQSKWKQFYKHEDITKNWPVIEIKERLKTHSTQVRDFVKNQQNDPHFFESLSKMVGEDIARYIEEHGLYGQ